MSHVDLHRAPARGAHPAATLATPAQATPSSSQVTETVVEEGRILDLTIDSPLLHVPGKVRLLLPPGYSEDPTRRWPVLWLLHGGADGAYTDWTEKGDVKNIVGDREVLVVMPDSGPCSGYMDWKDTGIPPRKWESFHMGELYDLLKNEYRVGDRQAIAGVSMGGGGALGTPRASPAGSRPPPPSAARSTSTIRASPASPRWSPSRAARWRAASPSTRSTAPSAASTGTATTPSTRSRRCAAPGSTSPPATARRAGTRTGSATRCWWTWSSSLFTAWPPSSPPRWASWTSRSG